MILLVARPVGTPRAPLWPLRWFVVLAIAMSCQTAFAQQPWSLVASPTSQILWGVCAGNGQFVAVGEAGTIITSTDGSNWDPRTSGTSKWLLDAEWSAEARLFAVVGDEGTILTSPDAITWTPQFSGTTQRLNSIAWGGGTFLAVGEAGTAVTSPDGINWTPRATGERGWLRGLAFGLGTFVTTGHAGTILTTSDGGVTFQRRGIATQLDLDAVTFAGTGLELSSGFEVTGADFIRANSSDGAFWRIAVTGKQPGITYNGVAWFNNTLVLVGDQGRIVGEGGQPLGSFPTTPGWRAVTSDSSNIIAVGTGGAIARAPSFVGGYRGVLIAAEVGPVRGSPVAMPEIQLGDRVVLHAVNAYPAPVTAYQWSLHDHPIAGATSATYTINSITLAECGTYKVTATVANGTISVTRDIAATPGPRQLKLFDESFRSDLPTEVAVAPTADGRIYVAQLQVFFSVNGHLQHGVARLKPDGSVDPSFDAGTGLGFEGVSSDAVPARVTQLFVQSDGRLVVRGEFGTVNGVSRPTLARLNEDGSLDMSFRPDSAFRDDRGTLVMLTDGRWLTANATTDMAGNRTVKLMRFLSDGSTDPSFGSTALVAPFAAPIGQTTNPRVLANVTPDGHVFVATAFGGTGTPHLSYFSGDTLLFRLTPAGVGDPTFRVARLRGEISELAAGRRGIVCGTSTWRFQRPSYLPGESVTLRLNFDGTVDESFHPIPSVSPLIIAPDDSIYAGSEVRGVVHFNANGDYDPNFALAGRSAPMFLISGGRFLVSAAMRRPDGTMGYLHVLVPNRRAATTRLANMSVRARVDAAQPLLVGFVSSGGQKTFLARAAGPALTPFGVADALHDPEITLFRNGALVGANDNWEHGVTSPISSVGARLGAFPFTESSRDSALLTTADPGAYSFHAADVGGQSGIVLAELYDADSPPSDGNAPRLVNFSTRTTAGSGENTLIAGFTVAGNNTRRILVRAVGPGLARFDVTDTLPDPVLTVYRDGIPIATNDDWRRSPIIAAAARAVGAFELDSKDAAVLLYLPPGSYTAHITAGGSTGVALLEVYEVP